MAYSPQTWTDGPGGGTPISAARLTVMETGIEDADTRITALETVTTNSQSGSYTLVLSDAGKLVENTSGSANNLTVPPNSSVAFPVGTVVGVRQYGAGLMTVVAGSGVTIRSRGSSLAMAGQYGEASLMKRATDEWVLVGDLA